MTTRVFRRLVPFFLTLVACGAPNGNSGFETENNVTSRPSNGSDAGGGAVLGGGDGGALGQGGSVTSPMSMTCTPSAQAQPTIDCSTAGIQIAAPYASSYTCVDLGTVAAIPTPWGGFAIKYDEPSTILISGLARTEAGRLFSVPLARDAQCHVAGFTGASSDFAAAPNNEAGVTYGPKNVLFLAQAGSNQLGQLKPGSKVADKVVDMGALGMASTICGVGFVPSKFGGAGQMKFINWPSPGSWYSAEFAPDTAGTYDVTKITQTAALSGGAAGFVFIAAGSPGFPKDTVLVSEYDTDTVVAYELNGQSDPKPETRTPFISGLSGAQGGVVDPVSGDFLFSTYSTAHIIAVRGFKPPPPPPPPPK